MYRFARCCWPSLILACVVTACGGGNAKHDAATDTPADSNIAPVNIVKDLAVSDLHLATAAFIPGQLSSAQVTVQNLGNTEIASSPLQLFLSRDALVDGADIEVGNTSIAALAAAASISTDVVFTVPSNIAPGNYFVLARVNASEDVNPINNMAATTTQIMVVNSTSSGFALITTGQRSIALIPAGTDLLAVTLEDAALPSTNTGTSVTSSRVPARLKLNSCAADSIVGKLVCVGYDHATVAIFDIKQYLASGNSSDITLSSCDATLPGNNQFGNAFSGGYCIDCGVVVDPGNNRYVVANSNGYGIYDYTIKADGACNLLNHADIPINENFSIDSTHHRLIAAEYDAGKTFTRHDGSALVTAHALRVVDLNSYEVYRWDKAIDCSQLGEGINNCALDEIDSSSVDIATGIIALTDEQRSTSVFVDLGQAVFDATQKTFAAPYHADAWPRLAGRIPGTAIEPGSHLLFMEAEFSGSMAVLQLPSITGTANAFPTPTAWQINSALIPANDRCDANPGDGLAKYDWFNLGDPHGLAVMTSMLTGEPQGVLVATNKDCVAVVALNKLLNAPKDRSTNHTPIDGYDLEANGIIRFIPIK